MLEQRDLDLMTNDAQIEIEEILDQFNKAFLGGRYGYNNTPQAGLAEQTTNAEDFEQEPASGGNLQPQPVSGQPVSGGF